MLYCFFLLLFITHTIILLLLCLQTNFVNLYLFICLVHILLYFFINYLCVRLNIFSYLFQMNYLLRRRSLIINIIFLLFWDILFYLQTRAIFHVPIFFNYSLRYKYQPASIQYRLL